MSGDGLRILAGEPIVWRYTVTNTGNVALSDVAVSDDHAGVTPAYVSGDTNGDGNLDTTEAWVFEAGGTAVAGGYANTGTASGTCTDTYGHTRTTSVSDSLELHRQRPEDRHRQGDGRRRG